ncbi:hypothetical protein [Pseudorhodoplanes sp.]|uniref:hypothetical protein n=1 Tax=Pseudorhodoplanes sp. TaxID=1934341 RepID=UPI00391C6B08
MQLPGAIDVSVRLAVAAGAIGATVVLASCGAAKDPESAYQARCARCHGPSDIQNWGRQRRDPVSRQAWLEEFLKLHYPPSEAERPLVIEYIQKQIAEGGK